MKPIENEEEKRARAEKLVNWFMMAGLSKSKQVPSKKTTKKAGAQSGRKKKPGD